MSEPRGASSAAMSAIDLEHQVEAMNAMTNNLNMKKLLAVQAMSNRNGKNWDEMSKYKNVN